VNYCEEIREALVVLDENHAAQWVALTEMDLEVPFRQEKPDRVARRLMGRTSGRFKTGSLGILRRGGAYIFHKDRWRKVVRFKNGKHRLEGSLCD